MPSTRAAAAVAVLLLVAVAGVVVADFVRPEPDEGTERAVVTIHDDETGERLGVVRARLAVTGTEKYTGLSETTNLPNGTGMLFVYEGESQRTFVMREMAFPLDMIFVGADGRITEIHEAPVEDDGSDLTRYRGRAQWVLEVPMGWSRANGVAVGDRIEIDYPGNASVTPTPGP